MIALTCPTAVRICSPYNSSQRSAANVASSKAVVSPLCPGNSGKAVAGSVSKGFGAGQQNAGLADSRLWKCRSSSGEVEATQSEVDISKKNAKARLASGSPIIVVEAPPMLKTAEPMPMMRPNLGLIKAGDAGRIIDRRPKDVWAVRFAAGAYLIDGKYFEALVEE